MQFINGEVSHWWREQGQPRTRPALNASISADVCIVGAGYTGLWTAYYLLQADPTLSVVILDARFAGFGASGRNGGWLTNSITGGRGQYVKTHGRDAAERFQFEMNGTVDEVIRVAAAEGIDADIVKGGELNVAYTPAQQRRLAQIAASESAWRSSDVVELSAEEVTRRIDIPEVTGGVWHPHAARIHPVKLVTGLAAVVERMGAKIYENTFVDEIRPGHAVTKSGVVSAPIVVRATEGFTPDLKGQHRTWLPMNSSLIVTEPLPAGTWEAIGWHGRETLGDFAHVYIYAQRTHDDRIAIGGRGVPYLFGSHIDRDGFTDARTVRTLSALLHRFFPAARSAPIEHAWSGVLGVPRDWAATVGLDPKTGLAWAGGYVGTGVSSTNLAGRTLADLIVRNDSSLVRHPWVNRQARKWEPEPLRWLAVRGLYAAYGFADRAEFAGRDTTHPIARVADLITGRK